MELELLPLLQVQRDLLDTPRGFERFGRYLDTMLDADRGEMTLPLAVFNPMAQPHVAALLDRLIAMGAEDEARVALRKAEADLRAVPGRLRVGLVIADDALGGWTDRFLTDARQRFESASTVKRGFATPLLWTGEEPSREGVRRETLAAVYRAAYCRRHGPPRTLRAMLTQEGLTARFAALPTAQFDPAQLAATRLLLTPHLDTTDYPLLFACLYGDEAARAVGYPPQGVQQWGGFAVALDEARVRGWRPDAALGAGSARVEFGR